MNMHEAAQREEHATIELGYLPLSASGDACDIHARSNDQRLTI